VFVVSAAEEIALQIFWVVLMGSMALFWMATAADIAWGVRAIPSLQDFASVQESECPRISILFAGRDEARKLPDALNTLLTLDYPRYEVIAADDRSDDATWAILEATAQRDARLKIVRISSLPPGWLGKPHALQQAYERSKGEWLVFTDADVHFEPNLLRGAMALARANRWEHLTLFGAPKTFTFGERLVMTFFGLAFLIGTRPWSATNPRSHGYTGVGAFQMVRRGAYEKMGTHKRLAMEVIDDMKLGKLAKDAGIRSGVARAGNAVTVHWHEGVGNTIRGTTKNFFAASQFRISLAVFQILGVLLMCVFPALTLPFLGGWAETFAAISFGVPLILAGGVAFEFAMPVAYALTYPLGAAIFAWMIARSAIVTLRQGGIVWRGTFYRLEELKRGIV
jgi:cellulose synthase/poly-beta-1,6-N-acetylglucosamine synthase-like glycosyltransferase